jgi:uroporphyrin-III C-methyltransferase/precorrin-2 dehydrogenase/sirohydrochlorin ferrochelatase
MKMLTLVQGEFIPPAGYLLAGHCRNDDDVNQRVSDAAKRGVSSVTWWMRRAASFIMPSIIDRSPLMVAVSSGGRSPVLARLLRESWSHSAAASRPAGPLCRPSARAREKQFATVGERRFWEKLFVNDRLAQSLANEDRQAVAIPPSSC